MTLFLFFELLTSYFKCQLSFPVRGDADELQGFGVLVVAYAPRTFLPRRSLGRCILSGSFAFGIMNF